MSGDEEIGYPHELILKALSQSLIAINGKYLKRVKLLANFLRYISEERKSSIELEGERDPTLLLLESMTEGCHEKVRKCVSSFREEIRALAKDFESTQSETSYLQFLGLLKEGIFLHVLCIETKNCELFNGDDIAEFSKLLDYEENESRAILSAIQIWNRGANETVPHTLVFEFATFKDKALQEAAIFLSYILAMQYPKDKRELLLVHYLLVRRAVVDFKSIVGQEDLSDDLLANLFKIAIVLFYCGYSESLRLPKEEKILYAQNVLSLPSIESSVKEAFDEVATIKIPKIHLRFPIWVLLAMNSFFLILHWYREIYLPLQTSQWGLQITIPDVPAFLVVAFFISLFTLFRLYRLRANIVRRLRRGTIN